MKYLITFSYDGSKYNGYQKQPSKKTVQKEIEDVLTKINSNKSVSISSSGRTDRLVHALNQKAHFEMKDMDLEKLKNSINKLLSSSIYVKKIEKVKDDFHARFDVKSKVYVYYINIGEYNPIEKDYVYQYNKNLDIEKMKEAIKHFEGMHNFRAFTKVEEEKDFVRTIFKTNIEKDDDKIKITFEGNGFLRYMVRNMVGLLIEIGSLKRNSSDVQKIMDSLDRTKAGITAPAEGLYLKDVYY